MQRRKFMMVLAAGGATIALSACDTMPTSAVAPWLGPDGSETDPRLRALSWAMLAPNPHNLQSWQADIREPDLIKLYVDQARLLPETDPPHRQILIGCGAFLELLRIAASHDGWDAVIKLMPQGDYGVAGVDARAFAEVRFVRNAQLVADPLFLAVRNRRTNRLPYEAKVPDEGVLAALTAAAARPGISLMSSNSAAQVARIREIAIAGYRAEFTNPATWGESADVVRLGSDAVAAEPSGIAVLGTKVWFARKLGFLSQESMRKTDGLGVQSAIDSSVEAANNTHAWIWLVSADNSRQAQIETGRAYMRIDLTATTLGVAIHPNSQVLQEFPLMAALYQSFHREVGVAEPARVQMLSRIGYAPPPGPAARRPVQRILRA
ncbi:MAG: twin-arginine translocation pathway signal protein [Pseudomonadota bacterium]